MNGSALMWVVAILFGIPYVYVISRVVAHAYFQAKLVYQLSVISNLSENGAQHDGKEV